MPIKKVDLQIQVHISEFEKLREEILHHMNTEQQSFLITLGSASVAIPILLSQTSNTPSSIIAILLYLLSIVYSIIGMNFASAAFTFGAIGKYVNTYLEPEINNLLETDAQHKVLYWETFLRLERGKFIAFFLSVMGPFGSTILILFPSFSALLAAKFVLLMSIIQPVQENATIQFISSWLFSLSIVAWIVFVLSTLAVIFSTLYHSLIAKWAIF